MQRRKASFDPKTFLAKVGEGKTISKYRKDQIVFSQGEIADAVFYIQQGKVKLTVVSEQGKEAVVAIVGPGHFFGEGCLNGHPLRIATTRAVDDDCVIATFSSVRRTGKADSSTSRMISSFSEAGYLMWRPPHPPSRFF